MEMAIGCFNTSSILVSRFIPHSELTSCPNKITRQAPRRAHARNYHAAATRRIVEHFPVACVRGHLAFALLQDKTAFLHGHTHDPALLLDERGGLLDLLAEDVPLEEVGEPDLDFVVEEFGGGNGEDLCRCVSARYPDRVFAGHSWWGLSYGRFPPG